MIVRPEPATSGWEASVSQSEYQRCHHISSTVHSVVSYFPPYFEGKSDSSACNSTIFCVYNCGIVSRFATTKIHHYSQHLFILLTCFSPSPYCFLLHPQHILVNFVCPHTSNCISFEILVPKIGCQSVWHHISSILAVPSSRLRRDVAAVRVLINLAFNPRTPDDCSKWNDYEVPAYSNHVNIFQGLRPILLHFAPQMTQILFLFGSH
jgi:hypothetical protein